MNNDYKSDIYGKRQEISPLIENKKTVIELDPKLPIKPKTPFEKIVQK